MCTHLRTKGTRHTGVNVELEKRINNSTPPTRMTWTPFPSSSSQASTGLLLRGSNLDNRSQAHYVPLERDSEPSAAGLALIKATCQMVKALKLE